MQVGEQRAIFYC